MEYAYVVHHDFEYYDKNHRELEREDNIVCVCQYKSNAIVHYNQIIVDCLTEFDNETKYSDIKVFLYDEHFMELSVKEKNYNEENDIVLLSQSIYITKEVFE